MGVTSNNDFGVVSEKKSEALNGRNVTSSYLKMVGSPQQAKQFNQQIRTQDLDRVYKEQVHQQTPMFHGRQNTSDQHSINSLFEKFDINQYTDR